MSTAPRQSFWVRNRWALPVLLALLVAAIVLGFTLGPKLKSSATSATATPTATAAHVTVVITATPSTPAPTTGPGVSPCPAATPGNQGGSTPLPNASPVPTVPGLCTGMITRPQHDVSEIQAGADRSDPAYTYYLNPISVVNKNLPQYGFRDPFQIVSPTRANPTPTPYTGQDGRPVVKAVVRYDNQLYTIQVAQPGVQGPKGIWVIVTIFPPGSA